MAFRRGAFLTIGHFLLGLFVSQATASSPSSDNQHLRSLSLLARGEGAASSEVLGGRSSINFFLDLGVKEMRKTAFHKADFFLKKLLVII